MGLCCRRHVSPLPTHSSSVNRKVMLETKSDFKEGGSRTWKEVLQLKNCAGTNFESYFELGVSVTSMFI